ncbi:MAG: hypothetical protein HFH57_14185 [Lachnospiraceae bacterium]|nr:hypothetical protein [Lachnospiraceae bacterium]
MKQRLKILSCSAVFLAICSLHYHYVVPVSASTNSLNTISTAAALSDTLYAQVQPEILENEETTFQINGGIEGTDYTFENETKTLTILTDKELELSGNLLEGTLNINSFNEANIKLNGLYIRTPNSTAINIMSNANVYVCLGDKSYNELNCSEYGIETNNGGKLIFHGNGLLCGNTIKGNIQINGGNILSGIIGDITDSNGTQLANHFITHLNSNTLYSVSGNGVYSYADGIFTNSTGNVNLYLPYIVQGVTPEYRIQVTGTTLIVKEITTPSPSLTPSPSPAPMPPDTASPANNGLYYIDSGTTYRSGAVLQFYATGAGYGPEEPQELNPINKSTRYIPVNWAVSTKSKNATRNVKGSWSTYTEETTGMSSGGYYRPGEYRYKGAFILKTTVASSVPYTLKVNYQKQVYDGNKGIWKNEGKTVSKSVSFYIRNTTINVNDSAFSIKNNSKIEIGSQKTLKVSGLATKPIFSSSDKRVAKIGKKTGKITALKAGTTVITVKAPAIGQYNGFNSSITIRVVPKTVKVKSVVSGKKGRLTIKTATSNKRNTGYKIQYQYAFGDIHTITINSKNPLNYTIKGLKSGKRCRVRVCAYKKAGGTIYSGRYSIWKDAGKIK